MFEFLLTQRGQIVLYVAYGLIGWGAFLVARMLMQEQELRDASENLNDLKNRSASNALVKLTRPFFTQYVVPTLRGKKFWDNKRLHYKRKLVAAGLREELTPDEFIAFKAFLIVFFPLVGGMLNAGGFLDVSWFYLLLSGVLGWFYPDFWMKGRIQARQKKILKALPFIVDLLTLSTEAGLDFIGSIGKVVEKGNPSPLIDELSQLLKEIKVGSSRQEALREMALRVDMAEVNSFVAILISADQMGASIGKVLRQQSDQIRSERMIRAERAGAVAAQKLMIPLMCCAVPAVFIMIIGPVVLGFIYGGNTGL
jgi:tight adherence protein C